MQHKVFGQRTFELSEQAVAFTKSSRRQLGQTAKQTYIHQINFEGGEVIVSGHRQSRSGAAVNFVNKSGIHQPLQSVLIFTGSCSFFDNLVDELFIFSCQLRRNGLPDHRYLRELAYIGMLCKVTFIGADNSGQGLLHSGNITGFRPHQHRFRHPASHIVHLQLLIQRIEKRIGNRFNGIHTFQICSKVFITIGNQKFRKSHRINLHEVDLSNRKRRRLCQGDTQQRAGTGNVVLRSVLTEILHGVDDLGAVLHLIKDDESLFGQDFLTTGQHQILQDTINVFGGFEKLFVFLVFIKVEICGIFIVVLAELF